MCTPQEGHITLCSGENSANGNYVEENENYTEDREGVKWELGFAFFRGWEIGFCALGLGFMKKQQ